VAFFNTPASGDVGLGRSKNFANLILEQGSSPEAGIYTSHFMTLLNIAFYSYRLPWLLPRIR
jgi:hypothetical protein